MMSRWRWGVAAILAGVAVSACSALPGPDMASSGDGIDIDLQYRTLDNGLRVALARDASVSTVTVAMFYGVGFRKEPQGRTGFAHLFEHLMFEGSEYLPEGEFDRLIYGAGGVNNGSTRFDYTNYYEVVPSNALEAVLWAEADRMARPVINDRVLENQKGVVTNEVYVNVLNQPYGAWIWLDLPMMANENWYNAHNFYGDLDDLQAASLEDAESFHATYYTPNNAVLVVAGDLDYDATWAMVEANFGAIPRGEDIAWPDVSEPRQESEKRGVKEDALAPTPALAFGYHVPERGTPEYYAMAVLDQLLVQGDDSLLHQRLVREEGFSDSVFGGINILDSMYEYDGPMLWSVGLIHDADDDADTILAAVDEVIAPLTTAPLSPAEIERARTKLRSQLYDAVDSSTRFGLVNLIASFALFDDDPGEINRIEEHFAAVTPELVQATAREYLRATNRAALEVVPTPGAGGAP
jgi:predicted Zn-dependent peptidase